MERRTHQEQCHERIRDEMERVVVRLVHLHAPTGRHFHIPAVLNVIRPAALCGNSVNRIQAEAIIYHKELQVLNRLPMLCYSIAVVFALDGTPDQTANQQNQKCRVHQKESRIFPTTRDAENHRGNEVHASKQCNTLERGQRNHAQHPNEIAVEETVRGKRRRQSGRFRIRLRQGSPEREDQERDENRHRHLQRRHLYIASTHTNLLSSRRCSPSKR